MTQRVSVLLCALLLASTNVRAQLPDSGLTGLRRAVAATSPDSAKLPISARRAFLSSFLLPGYGQTRLERPRAAMLFSVVEVLSVGMAMKAQQDLREAKSAVLDSIPATFKIDPATGIQVPDTYIRGRFNSDRVNARRTHYEDWIAALVFNHLLAGADAYVSANLWDFKANIGATASASGVRVGANLSW